MAKFNAKKKSKRQPARQRYRIEKKVRDHNRKVRKEQKKKGPKGTRNRIVTIPNICPFKEDILKEVEEVKKHKEEERQKQRELAKQQKMEKKPTDLQTLVSSAETRDAIHESLTPALAKENTAKHEKQENSLKAYYKEFKKVIEAADVVLEIVDARDPLGTRCIQVEEAVRNGNKKLVVVLNKADLIPRANLENWLKYLRGNVLAVPFKAGTQMQKKNLGRRKLNASSSDKSLQGGTSVGAELLMSLLGNYTRNKGIKTSIIVGVVGLPNVGKSSLINSLKRARACNVGSTPGVTKAMQEVLIDSKIKLLDSPGIVFAKSTGADDNAVVLKNAISVGSLKDPFTAANAILQRINKKILCEMYDVVDFSTPEEFYALKAARMGRFKKGGIADIACAARNLLEDWNSGKIKFYTEPPESKTHLGASIVSNDVKEFDINSFKSEEATVLDQFGFDIKMNDSAILLESLGPVNAQIMEEEPMEEDDKTMKEDTLLSSNINILENNKEIKSKTQDVKQGRKRKIETILEGNQQLNKNIKNLMKKNKKDRTRREKKTSEITSVLEGFNLGGDEDYDFNQL